MLRHELASYSAIQLAAYGMPEIENEIDVRPLISYEDPKWYGMDINCLEPEIESLWLPDTLTEKLKEAGIRDCADLADLSFENIVSRASLSSAEAQQLRAWSEGEIVLEIEDEELLKKLQNVKHKSLFSFSQDGCHTKREKIARFKELYEVQLSNLQKLVRLSNDSAAAILCGRLCAYGVIQGEEQEYYERALHAGCAQAANDLGVLLHRTCQYPDANDRIVRLYMAACDCGVLEANYNLALAYLHFRQDPLKAEKYLRQANNLGVPEAENALAYLLEYPISTISSDRTNEFMNDTGEGLHKKS